MKKQRMNNQSYCYSNHSNLIGIVTGNASGS